MIPFFDLGKLVDSEKAEILQSIDKVISSGQYIGGLEVTSFEENFAKYLQVNNFVSVANGLDAIRLLLESYEIGPGHEVLVPAFTYYATWLGVTQAGATPVPVDVNLSTANIDYSQIEQSITSKTKAILVVHLYGQPADMEQITAIAQKHNLYVFEDCAQSHGATSSIGMTGSCSDGAAFSFYPTKNLGALGDAGGVAVNNPHISETIRSRRSYGQGKTKYDHVDTGWNSRMDPIQAAVLNVHLAKLEHWTQIRRGIATQYLSALGTDRLSATVGPSDVTQSVWHHFVIKAKDRAKLIEYFMGEGISTDVHYPYAVNELKPMKPFMDEKSIHKVFPSASLLSNQVLSLPMGPWMVQNQIDKVAKSISNIPDELLCTN